MEAPKQQANIVGRDNIIVQAIDSDVTVTGGERPYLRLTQYTRRTQLAARDNSETGLLSAYRSDVAPLIGRSREMAELRRWLDDAAPVSIRVLFGAGGRGKTRLALELVRAISDQGWLAGFVDDKDFRRFREQSHVELWRWDKPVLVVIDYAASRAAPIAAWVRELVDASLEDRPPLRLLLLERQANAAIGWVATVFGLGNDDASRAARALLDPREPIELPALDDLAFRREIFAATLKQAPPVLGADPQFDRWLENHKWAGDPLFLLMAGLVAAEAGVREALSLSRTDLALSIAEHELDRIGRIGAARGVDVGLNKPGAFVRHMAVLATLTQGLTAPRARSLAEAEMTALKATASLDAAIEALTDALPGAGGGVAPILPDIIGEGAILAWLGAGGDLERRGHASLPRIAAAARLALGPVSTTLVRAAQDFAAAGRLEPIRWLEALAEAPEADLGALIEISDALPRETLALRETAAHLYARITDALRDAARAGSGSEREVALLSIYSKSLVRLGNSLSRLGRREHALDAAREAVEIRRRLAAERPDAFLPDLAASQNNLGAFLSELGRREHALDAAREAADIYRRLAAERPDDFLSDLAASLNNLGIRLSKLGRREHALDAAREAVEIRRRLAAEWPDAFLPDLAKSLNNLGAFLSELGRREHALDAAREAADIYRRLAAERPDAFLPDLAISLNNLGAFLSELGRREHALDATREAVEIRRRLAAERPDAFLPDLAASLHNLGSRLSELGRREHALDAAREAVEIRRRLAAERPDAFLPDLAMSLNNLGNRLSELGRREHALDAAREAVDICRRLAAERPDAFLPDLAGSLNNLGNSLSELGRREHALDAAREAVEIRRRLAAERPDALLPDLAASLNNLGNRLSELGRREDALDAAREAVEICRRLAAERPDAFLPDLAASLNNLGNRLSELGRREHALDAAREAAEIRRRLAVERPDAFLPDLAGSLNNLGNRLSELGRREHAVDAAREAVEIRRRLAAERPDAFLPDLAGSLGNLGKVFSALGRREDALDAAREAVTLFGPVFLRLPRAHDRWMVMMYRQYLKSCEALGVEPDATLLAPIVEALQRPQGLDPNPQPEV